MADLNAADDSARDHCQIKPLGESLNQAYVSAAFDDKTKAAFHAWTVFLNTSNRLSMCLPGLNNSVAVSAPYVSFR